jgi:hypothetical protein
LSNYEGPVGDASHVGTALERATSLSNHEGPVRRPTHTQPDSGEGRWEPSDEPTRLERLIAAQFRRGLPVPLTPVEQQRLLGMSLEQRCDYIAKAVVWTARGIEKHILETSSFEGADK